MAFPPQFLDELRARLAISAVAGRTVRLTRRGAEHSGLCPFHAEKSPSFTINDDKGFYHCFGCGAHGDVLSFVMRNEGLPFPEAVERLAAEAGLKVPQATPEDRARSVRQKDLLDLLEEACLWYQGQLTGPVGREARAYLAHRGLDSATIDRFRLGYAPDQRGALRRALADLGATPQQIGEIGVVKNAPDGGTPRDYFFSRVIFPITDTRGRVIAFGGRTLGDGQPKYLNSPETPLFHKGKVLYGVALARETVRKSEEVIVTEGYMDVIALAQAGFHNAVAPLGTALTADQLQALWRLAPEPLLCFDGDAAGQRAARRAAERAMPLLQPGQSLRFIAMPAGEDPDSLVANHGPGAFTAAIAAAKPLVDMIWQHEVMAKPLNTPERRADLERRLNLRVEAITDRSVQFQYRAEFRDRLRCLFTTRRGANGRGDQRRQGHRGGRGQGQGQRYALPPREAFGPRIDVANLPTQQEYWLLALIINHPGLIEHEWEALSQLNLSGQRLDRLLREILNLAASRQDLDSRDIHRHLMGHGFEAQLKKVASPALYRQAAFAAPNAPSAEAGDALAGMLAAFGKRRLTADRAAAERDLADNMTDEGYERLRRIMAEQADGGTE
ncbi:MAG: DNA primase [Alphaproteobacteria bacterium]